MTFNERLKSNKKTARLYGLEHEPNQKSVGPYAVKLLDPISQDPNWPKRRVSRYAEFPRPVF